MQVHRIRSWRGDGEPVSVQIRSPTDAISYHCSECMGWETSPEECPDSNCPLYIYRPNKVRKRSIRRST